MCRVMFPAEIRNALFECSVLADGASKVDRAYKSVGADNTIKAMDTVHSFFIDPVTEHGKSELFSNDITKVAVIADELLSLVLPWILFTFDNVKGLELFAETFSAHTAVCNREIPLHVEIDLCCTLNEKKKEAFACWEESPLPHGRALNAHDMFEGWMAAAQDLPPQSTHLYLVFTCFWRDFRALRGLSRKMRLNQYQLSFRFDTDPSLPHHDFFVAQTIAAVHGIEVTEQAGISEAGREELYLMLVQKNIDGDVKGRRDGIRLDGVGAQ
ncbi:hypothetical protein SNOG_10651 [Parastagonospora nodorum SN15]|uniref:Uncharacterized protein n=1 Tax=Phaeosphaeria nodorum (strain SN15 / ATCC MYA-4574 / FGSC 10173) TaxID=321614 RepID=Q0UC63_PHANO|nr:hypothetical protein SNOG_10651 [Parastagonospora nodorum SN15]EAT82045.2 hypothetical protein SNOG_10651 [Parastagonospora nodorum SN15]